MIISYDMETTGLSRENDDILQLSIVDEQGNELFNKTPYKWKKLGQAADFFGYDWGAEHAHDSLADAKATMFVYRNLTEVADYLNG